MTATVPPEVYADLVRENILRALEAAGKTRYDMWKELGWSESATYRRFDGSVEFSLTQIEQTARWLNIPISDLTT